MLTTIGSSLNWATKRLTGISSSPSLDAEVLLCHILNKNRTWLHANPDKILSKLQTAYYKLLTGQRSRRWPVAYLTGHKEFFGLDFKVTKDVLIPRPETELLVELALTRLLPLKIRGRRRELLNIIDLGTGSGNIIVSLAVIANGAKQSQGDKIAASSRFGIGTPRNDVGFYATDISTKALKIARANARRHGVRNKIKFLQGNLLGPLSSLPLMRGRISGGHSYLLIANLPYLTQKQIKSNPELSHEPRSALVAGKDGMKYYRELFKQLHALCHSGRDPESNTSLINTGLDSRLPPTLTSSKRSRAGRGNDKNITILLEYDPRQKQKLQSLAKRYFPKAQIKFHRDLASQYRVMEIKIGAF